MALTINRLGMALMRMGQVSDSVRFLDETDMTFSLDSRTSAQEHMTSMELSMKPIVFRASYRDINLIMAIVNKAISLYGESASPSPSPSATAVTHSLKSTTGLSSDVQRTSRITLLLLFPKSNHLFLSIAQSFI